MTVNSITSSNAIWFLAGQVGKSSAVRHVPIHATPFLIGRRSDLSLCLPSPTVSNMHAEIVEEEGSLWIRDLNSTNGTYVNGRRVSDVAMLNQDDLVHFAEVAFRVRRQVVDRCNQTRQEDVCDQALALVQFDRLMSERAVIPYFQPIVHVSDMRVAGYEVLGRSRLVGLETPRAMFMAASQLNLEVELSRMFRWEGIQTSLSFIQLPHLFVNTHPAELVEPGLLDSLRAIRESHPVQSITLEIHEAAVTNAGAMKELRQAMTDLDISLAYDDFGSGQNRLVELVEVRPDYLKFDMELVQGIHLASAKRQQMLATLVQMVRELGIVPLAEGVECEAEAEACRQLQFELAQGFFYGKPVPARLVDGSR